MVDNIKEEFFDFMEDLATLSPTIISPEPIQPQITYYFGQNQENEQKTVQPTVCFFLLQIVIILAHVAN